MAQDIMAQQDPKDIDNTQDYLCAHSLANLAIPAIVAIRRIRNDLLERRGLQANKPFRDAVYYHQQ